MVSYYNLFNRLYRRLCVLILIVVEDGLVQALCASLHVVRYVLILIVVEDGLVQIPRECRAHDTSVLILIVVEDGLVQV